LLGSLDRSNHPARAGERDHMTPDDMARQIASAIALVTAYRIHFEESAEGSTFADDLLSPEVGQAANNLYAHGPAGLAALAYLVETAVEYAALGNDINEDDAWAKISAWARSRFPGS